MPSLACLSRSQAILGRVLRGGGVLSGARPAAGHSGQAAESPRTHRLPAARANAHVRRLVHHLHAPIHQSAVAVLLRCSFTLFCRHAELHMCASIFFSRNTSLFGLQIQAILSQWSEIAAFRAGRARMSATRSSPSQWSSPPTLAVSGQSDSLQICCQSSTAITLIDCFATLCRYLFIIKPQSKQTIRCDPIFLTIFLMMKLANTLTYTMASR